MFRIAITFALAAVCLAQTEHTLETHLLVPASPLQAYRAFTVDWQLKQWHVAHHVTMYAETGGIWRIEGNNGSLQEGRCIEAVTGERFVYTIIGADTQTVEVTIGPVENGCNVHISQRATGASVTPDSLQKYWSALLPDLRRYLTGLPAGYEARPQSSEKVPAVLVLHDKFGVNRTIRALCDSLAQAGYVAVAADMFRGEIVTSTDDADRFVDIANPTESVGSAKQALEYLRDHPRVQKNRIIVWGLGYGGTMAYELAATDAKLRGVVTWYAGKLPEPDKREALTGPLLAIFGDADSKHPRPEIESFDQSLVQAGVRAETVIVSGGSTFAEPQSAEGYNLAATQEAWRQTLNFLDQRLKL